MKVTFYIWGIGGLVWMLMTSIALQSPSSNIFNFANIVILTLIWIGGMVLFGLSAIISKGE